MKFLVRDVLLHILDKGRCSCKCLRYTVRVVAWCLGWLLMMAVTCEMGIAAVNLCPAINISEWSLLAFCPAPVHWPR